MAGSLLQLTEHASDMKLPWKQQIQKELKKRDRVQLGNYGSLVESYNRLLEAQYEQRRKIQDGGRMIQEQPEEPVTCHRSSSKIFHSAPDCALCLDSERQREEIVILQKQLDHIESEHQHLLTLWMEGKMKAAERINKRNAREERYWTLLQLKAQSQESHRNTS
ncbi:uncharacterized protein O3C94_011217 [Discoglossus pictus]